MPAQEGPEGLPRIPAMTTDAERECYYRLAKDGAQKGEVVELGAWLGASSAWIAAGVRDSKANRKAKVYDRFADKPVLDQKAERWCAAHGVEHVGRGSAFEQFRTNLGPLLQYVEPNRVEIGGIKWLGGPVSVLICDAPKRVKEIAPVLDTFRKALQPGAIMAWQDFGHFPSYAIPACLYRIRHHLEFVEAVVPGTTMVFQVRSQWGADEVTANALSLNAWSPDDVVKAWAYWLQVVPHEKAHLFECGAALFLCDIGHPELGTRLLSATFESNAPAIVKKWRYLKDQRSDFLTRYAPLFEYLERQGVFDTETV
jgi:hypothetical protein